MRADNVRGRDCPKIEYLAEKRSFEGKHQILRTITHPRTLSANIPAKQEGVYLFYNTAINFHIVLEPLAKSQC